MAATSKQGLLASITETENAMGRRLHSHTFQRRGLMKPRREARSGLKDQLSRKTGGGHPLKGKKKRLIDLASVFQYSDI